MNLGTKILVVDDFQTMRRIIRNLLEEIGFSDVAEADDGTTALPKLLNGHIDLLITDWNMPKMSGLELVQKLRADPKFASLPVLMVTAEAKREQIVEAAKAGINGYIVKPFTAVTLKEKLEKLLST